MDALLILGGLLLIVAGLVWLVMLAFGTSLLWGIGSLLPPLTLFYVVGHWRTARKAVVVGALGFIPLVVGLTLLANHDAQRLEAILSLNWLKTEVQEPPQLAIQLNGELNGRPFLPQQGELINGTLSLREGLDFFANQEISVRLPQPSTGPVQVDVLPQDREGTPEIEISWLLPEQELPEARRLSHGYILHLDLQPVAPNRLAGDFHLVLPPQFKTNLSGRVELFTDRLRYRDGQVDTRFDSMDTLTHVIQDYLQRRFASRQVQLAGLPPQSFPATELTLEVQAQIDGQAQRLPLQLSKTELRGWTVQADRFPALPVETTAVATAAVAPVERVSRPLDRRQRFSLERLLANPSRYQGLTIRLVSTRGSTAEGRFDGVDTEGRVVIRRQMGGQGEARFELRPEEIGHIELLEP
ncbi:MAG: MFS transporter [Pseudomonadota bacterium]